MKNTDFALMVTRYLTVHLNGQRNLSPNTIISYRDTFSLLLIYLQQYHCPKVEKITIAFFRADVIEGFLHWLESDRSCSISTRNQRLAAIRAFFRFVQMELPEQMLICQQILAIPMKKKPCQTVRHLPEDDVQHLFASPDTSTAQGRRNLSLLCVLYDTGARVQELADLKVMDIHLNAPPVICIHGKGGKIRHVPIMKQTLTILSAYLDEQNLLCPDKQLHPVFFNARRQKLTRSGISYILKKYARQASIDANGKAVTPHVLRHTRAMHLLKSDINLIYIRDFLGHSDVTTTEIYARADAEMKRKAFEKLENSPIPSAPAWHRDNDLMAWLKNLGK